MTALEVRVRSLEAIDESSRGNSDAQRYMRSRSRLQPRPRNRDPAANGLFWYHWRFGSEARRCESPYSAQQPAENAILLTAASDSGHPTRRLFLTDRVTGISFLIDMGADLCVYPRKMVRGQRSKSDYELSAANWTIIHTYGTETMTLNFGLWCTFTWRFVITDVSKPIIGVDFLAFFGLLVDACNNRLVDQTSSAVTGRCVRCDTSGMKTVTGTMKYQLLVSRTSVVPGYNEARGHPRQTQHSTRHHIETMPGPPIVCRPRRLAPERLAVAKAEFQKLMDSGIIRSSKTSWSSLLYGAKEGRAMATLR